MITGGTTDLQAQVGPGDLRINEILASNQEGIRDEDGDQSDWIEIRNRSAVSVNLGNIYLTDDPNNLLKWKCPAINMPAGGFLLVFASGKDRAPLAGEPHTNFDIDRDGEFLAIVDSELTVIDQLAPEYPRQLPDISYGHHAGFVEPRYLSPSTPGFSNDESTTFQGFLPPVVFSPSGGFYEHPSDLILFHVDPLASVHFTVDGSTPTHNDDLYSSPIPVLSFMTSGQVTIIRARAFRPGFIPSIVGTNSYLFNQDEIIKGLPVMSVVTATDNLVGERGIFTNAQERGRAWERPANLELHHADGRTGFNVPLGIRVHGGGGRTQPKKSIRTYFREVYGHDRLVYPLIPDSTVEDFKRLVLRAGTHDMNHVNDELSRRLYQDMGHASAKGTFVHLFLNGDYQGVYNPTERLDRFFYRSTFNTDEDWDITGSLHQDGDLIVWSELLALVDASDSSGVMDATAYGEVQARLDVVNFADYMVLNLYSAVSEWPGTNWVVARERSPHGLFRFQVWDYEKAWGKSRVRTFDQIANVFESGEFDPNTPINRIWRGLRNNGEFRDLFIRRFRKRLFEDGKLTESSIMRRLIWIIESVREFIPNFSTGIPSVWIPGRRHNAEKNMDDNGFLEVSSLSFEPPPVPTLVINEVMAINDSTLRDEAGEHDDWVELFNLTNSALDLSGKFLTDNPQDSTKWEIPNGTMIGPRGRLLIWADNDVGQGPLHANFRLGGGGESVSLFDSIENGNPLLDRFPFFFEQRADVSVGRRPDGTGDVTILENPSPGEENGGILPEFSGGEPSRAFYGGQPLGNRSISFGDFDRDGLTDLAIANFDFGRVAIQTNQGDGVFHQTALVNTPRVGAAALAVGDLNGDSFPDLATANDTFLNHQISILLNDQNGSFEIADEIPINTGPERKHLHPRQIIAKDIDGNGSPDVLVQNESSARPGFFSPDAVISVLRNDGNGDFTLIGDLSEGVAILTSPQSLIVEDFSADALPDVATLSGGKELIIWLNAGGGNFGPASSVAMGPPPDGAFFRELISVVAGDFDTDGDSDLCACDGSGGNIHFFLNDGFGSFAHAENLRISSFRPSHLLSRDFDGDGTDDIAVFQTDLSLKTPAFVEILFSKQDGKFEASPPLSPGPRVPFLTDMTGADLDGDGHHDLAVIDEYNGTISVFFNISGLGPPTAQIGNWRLFH